MTESSDGGKKYTATTTDASAVNQDLLSRISDDTVLCREGEDCTFYYTIQNGTLVERAVFDDGHVGAVYQAGGAVDPQADGVEVLDADAWPTREDDFDTGAPVLVTDGGDSVYEVLLAVVDELDTQGGPGAPAGEVIEETLSRVGVGLAEVAEGIEDLYRKGEIYQPDETTVRRVGGDA